MNTATQNGLKDHSGDCLRNTTVAYLVVASRVRSPVSADDFYAKKVDNTKQNLSIPQ